MPTPPPAPAPPTHSRGKNWRAWIESHKKQAGIAAVGVGGLAAVVMRGRKGAGTAAPPAASSSVYPPDQTAYDDLSGQIAALGDQVNGFIAGGGAAGGGGSSGGSGSTSSGSGTTTGTEGGDPSIGVPVDSLILDRLRNRIIGGGPPTLQSSTGSGDPPPSSGNTSPVVSNPGNGPAPAPPKPSLAELASSIGLVGLGAVNEARYVHSTGHQTWWYDGTHFVSENNKSAPAGSTLYAEQVNLSGYNPNKTYKAK